MLDGWQARELLEVYERQGAEALEASKPPQLSWEQVGGQAGGLLGGRSQPLDCSNFIVNKSCEVDVRPEA